MQWCRVTSYSIVHQHISVWYTSTSKYIGGVGIPDGDVDVQAPPPEAGAAAAPAAAAEAAPPEAAGAAEQPPAEKVASPVKDKPAKGGKGTKSKG